MYFIINISSKTFSATTRQMQMKSDTVITNILEIFKSQIEQIPPGQGAKDKIK